VAGYTIDVAFEEESQIRWTYRAAPNEAEVGKTGQEQIHRADIHDGAVVLMCWLEKDGTNVLDILDLVNMKMYTNFVIAGGKRFGSKPDVAARFLKDSKVAKGKDGKKLAHTLSKSPS
jgi:hypothetical protein